MLGNTFVIAMAALGMMGTARATGQWESLRAVKGFADAILASESSVASRGKGVFTDNVVGEVDVLSSLSGREMASDYVFGPFAKAAAAPSIPSLFGIPTAYNVTGLTVQHSVVTATIAFDLNYPTLNTTVPLQVDGWFKVDSNDLISQFSLTFKHWSLAMETLVLFLAPSMGQMLSLPSNTSSTDVLTEYLTMATCLAATKSCTGALQQYDSLAACVAAMGTTSLGSWQSMADDSLICRAMASQLVDLDPTMHCANLGPSGGDMCKHRTYAQALQDPMPASWNAAKVVTPENEHLVKDMHFVSGEELPELLHISLSFNDMHSWDPSLYAVATFGYFLFLYFFTKVFWICYKRFSRTFASLSHEHQKNVIMYWQQIIFTTIALTLELLAAPSFRGEYHLWSIQCLRTGAVTISSLYIFELVFRFDMRLPLVAHHILTIIAISYAVVMNEWTQNPQFTVSGIIWLFQATLEQPTFVGLIGYRMKWKPSLVARVLKYSSIQTFIIKTASAIGVIFFWAKEQERYGDRPMDKAWSALVFTIAVGLMTTQVWGSYVTYIIGAKLERRALREDLEALPVEIEHPSRPDHKRTASDESEKMAVSDSMASSSTQLAMLSTLSLGGTKREAEL